MPDTDYRVEFDALRADLLKLANRCDRIRETWEITRDTDEYALGRYDMASLLGEQTRDILSASKVGVA